MTSTELVPLFTRPRKADRRRARWRRRIAAVDQWVDTHGRQRLYAIGLSGVAASTIAAVAVTVGTTGGAVADPVGIATPISVTAAPTPATIPPTTLPAPVAATTSTAGQPAPTHVDVDLPGWSGTGQLLTDGALFRRVYPGQLGRAVIVVPVDPTGAATFNTAGRQWRVVVRGRVADPRDATHVGETAVPTVLLVDVNAPHETVEAS